MPLTYCNPYPFFLASDLVTPVEYYCPHCSHLLPNHSFKQLLAEYTYYLHQLLVEFPVLLSKGTLGVQVLLLLKISAGFIVKWGFCSLAPLLLVPAKYAAECLGACQLVLHLLLSSSLELRRHPVKQICCVAGGQLSVAEEIGCGPEGV